MERLIALLVAAHLIADFFLQPDWLAKRKRTAGYLMLHVSIHAATTYVFLQAWTCWQAPMFVLVVHTLIDFAKQRLPNNTTKVFVVDQAAHILSLLVLGWLLRASAGLQTFEGVWYKPLIAFAGFVATVQASGIVIGKFAKQLTEENNLTLSGLLNGGKLIGQLERALIFLFVFIGQPAGIGFLVAAKSILRFEESKEQKLAEYVLIGTLLSFSLAVAIASVTKWAVTF